MCHFVAWLLNQQILIPSVMYRIAIMCIHQSSCFIVVCMQDCTILLQPCASSLILSRTLNGYHMSAVYCLHWNGPGAFMHGAPREALRWEAHPTLLKFIMVLLGIRKWHHKFHSRRPVVAGILYQNSVASLSCSVAALVSFLMTVVCVLRVQRVEMD
jgi:hypothetical protein